MQNLRQSVTGAPTMEQNSSFILNVKDHSHKGRKN